MKRLRVGINGFGRIGRAFARIALMRNSFDIVTVNTRKTGPDILSYLLQHDSVYRTFSKTVTHDDTSISVEGTKIMMTQSDKPEEIPWEKYDVDVVVDATGAFTKKEDLEKHIKGSVKKVILTAPAKDDTIPHVVLGVNEDMIDWKNDTVISNASCTTNCASPMFKVIDDNFTIVTGSLTTAHAYTQSQSLQDDPGKDIERSRSAPLNIVPSTTGAAKAVVKTLPQLEGKIDGMALRVPVPVGSFTDITIVTKNKTTIEEVNQKFKEASETSMKGILSYATEMLVSSDYIGSPYSCIFDSNYTKVQNGYFVKIYGWYDNEWGYSTRLVDLIDKLAEKSF